MISKINKNNTNLPKETNQSLKNIGNLSNYIVFLISDIIQHINNKDPNSLRVNFSKLDYKEILHFCYEILESLLFCNIKKKENIKTILIFDEKANSKYIKSESDEIRIKQILLNFISNSVKFCNQGEIKIKCYLKKFQGKYYIKIYVKDTGTGIKNEDMKKLFKEFVQLDNENTENNKLGSGLGLSICKNIAMRLNLKLNVKSEYRKGSKFSMMIPVDLEEDFLNELENDLLIKDNKGNFEEDNKINIINEKFLSFNNNKNSDFLDLNYINEENFAITLNNLNYSNISSKNYLKSLGKNQSILDDKRNRSNQNIIYSKENLVDDINKKNFENLNLFKKNGNANYCGDNNLECYSSLVN